MWKPWPWLRLSDAYTAGASAEQRSALAAAVVEGCCLVKKSSAWLVATVHRSKRHRGRCCAGQNGGAWEGVNEGIGY